MIRLKDGTPETGIQGVAGAEKLDTLIHHRPRPTDTC